MGEKILGKYEVRKKVARIRTMRNLSLMQMGVSLALSVYDEFMIN